jgi:hypothetical protein
MQVKDTNMIWTTTETGKTFGYAFRFKDDKLIAVHSVGSRGDIFPEDKSEYQDVYPDDEVTQEYMQKFYTTKILNVKCE